MSLTLANSNLAYYWFTEKKLHDERELGERFGGDLVGRLRAVMWDFLEYPETSKMSQLFHATSMFFVFLSTLTFLIESSHEYEASDWSRVLILSSHWPGMRLMRVDQSTSLAQLW